MLKNYSVDENDSKREENMNAEYIGQSVWIRGEIIEVAAEFPGGILINVQANAFDGEGADTEVLIAVDSDDLKVADEEDKLIDG